MSRDNPPRRTDVRHLERGQDAGAVISQLERRQLLTEGMLEGQERHRPLADVAKLSLHQGSPRTLKGDPRRAQTGPGRRAVSGGAEERRAAVAMRSSQARHQAAEQPSNQASISGASASALQSVLG